ncbi:MAG: hypothetical protein F9K18_06315 [Thermoanaerobaculia bacterium]|nr:MAG: hypothetical protein F9K18_06315 [Thermoanaerobaculia bacterium]
MARLLPLARFALPLALVAALGAACARDPARRIEAARARYSATVQSFVVRDDPEASRQQIVLDVLVEWKGGEPLPGLTLDVSMIDPGGREKARRRVYADVSRVDRGGAQVSLVLEEVPYAAGDGFSVEVRGPVPAAERGDYREFASGS